ncbi:MAG: winged helix-turn-helix domain-containing protein [Thermoplasmata archaeon]|nr:winged helix-turn-helix domain-containing protein [Thermoplasmata archaeon]
MVRTFDLNLKFGSSAGKVWKVLDELKLCSESELKKLTGLDKEEFYGAIGWLARENKIRKEEERYYSLGDTNLVGDIGKKAGKVWRALNIWDELSTSKLTKLTDLKEEELFSALGWLAREGKVELTSKGWKLK